MEYSTLAQLDVRASDRTELATIHGATYVELHLIVRERGGERSIVGLASAWPVIMRDARIAELTLLLSAAATQAAESERQCQALIARLEAAERVPPTVAAAATGMAPSPEHPHTCETCARTFASERGLQTHRRRAHSTPAKVAPVEPPWPPTPIAPVEPPWPPTPVEPPFVCAACGKAAFARSVRNPALCLACNAVAESMGPHPTNGHLVADT